MLCYLIKLQININNYNYNQFVSVILFSNQNSSTKKMLVIARKHNLLIFDTISYLILFAHLYSVLGEQTDFNFIQWNAFRKVNMFVYQC